MRSVVSIPKQAAEEAQENPKVAELKERLIKAYPRLFSGVANKNPPDRGRFGTARIKLKPNPKIYRHREYQLQGDRAEAMKKLLAEFIERGWIEPPTVSGPASLHRAQKEKGEWRLVVDYRGLNEQTEHDSYSLPLIDSILQKQQKKRIFTVLDLKQGYHQLPLHPDSRPCTAMSTPLGAHAVESGAYGRQEWQRRFPAHDGGPYSVLSGDCADPFLDDIIIGSGTENMTEDELIDAHEKDLRRVLSELDKHNMVCKPTKASLFVEGSGVRGSRGWSRATLSHAWEAGVPAPLGEAPDHQRTPILHGVLQLLFRLCPDVCRTAGAAAQDAASGQIRWPEGEQQEACWDP